MRVLGERGQVGADVVEAVGVLGTLVMVTVESLAFIAAVTFAGSSPVTVASLDPLRPGAALVLDDGVAGSAFAVEAGPSTKPPATTNPAAAGPIRRLIFNASLAYGLLPNVIFERTKRSRRPERRWWQNLGMSYQRPGMALGENTHKVCIG